MIIVNQENREDREEGINDLDMISKPAVDSGRHLRGTAKNGLSYLTCYIKFGNFRTQMNLNF